MATTEKPDRDFLLDIVRQGPMLNALREGPVDRRSLEERLGISKSTSHRNTSSLAEQGLLRRSNDEYTLTEYGQAVADVVTTFEADMETTLRLAPLFDAVDGIDPRCPLDAFADATVTVADRGDPFAPLARFVSLVRETSSLQMVDSYAIAPTYIDEVHGRVLDGLETQVIERPDVAEDIMKHYPAKCVQLCASEYLTMKVIEDVPFGLILLDRRVGIGVRDPTTGVPRTFVDTDDEEARNWAESLFDILWEGGTQLEHFTPKALREALESNTE